MFLLSYNLPSLTLPQPFVLHNTIHQECQTCGLWTRNSPPWGPVQPFRWFWKKRKKKKISQKSELLLSVHWGRCSNKSVGHPSTCALIFRLHIKTTHQASWMWHEGAAGGKCCFKGEKWRTSYLFTKLNGKPVCLECIPWTTLNPTIRIIMPRNSITFRDNWEQRRYKTYWPLWRNSSLFSIVVERWAT